MADAVSYVPPSKPASPLDVQIAEVERKRRVNDMCTNLPLWRLIVAMADAERLNGPDSPTVRQLAEELTRRMRLPIPG